MERTKNSFNFYAGLFCVTAATLMLQLIQTRILSVVAWYHLAFFVISTAMFGLTAGAVWVYLQRDRFSEKTLSFDLAIYSMAFAVSSALALAFQMTLVLSTRPAITTLLTWIELSVFLSLPFFFSGIVVSLALTRSPFPVGRVYGIDLIGAAAGCLGVLFLLNTSDGPSAVLWTSAIIALGAVLFSRSGIGSIPASVPKFSKILRWSKLWLLVLVAAAAFNTVDDRRQGLYPVYAKGELQFPSLPWFETWNSFSRVIANKPKRELEPAFMWGPSPVFVADDWRLPQSRLNIDGDAGTVAYGISGDLSLAEFLKYDITNLVYHIPNQRSAAIIGVGGGRDILSARVFGIPQVTGVEINPAFVDLLLHEPQFSEFVGLKHIDGVSLVVDEARSWFARSEDTFDVIQMSLIDTWAATGAGAFTLSENGLYTVEAWQIFLNRLNPDGVFTVSRWFSPQIISETGRMVSLAVAALMELGAPNPKDHIVLTRSGNIATLVVSRAGFSKAELQSLEAAAQRLQFNQLIVPGREPTAAVLRNILNASDRAELELYTRSQRLDLSPPTDDRPFFFNQLRLFGGVKTDVSGDLPAKDSVNGVVAGNLLATATLAMLFLISLGLVAGTIVVPLRLALKDVGARLATGGTIYFMLIGIGFMFVEIGLLQRFSVFLGHPIYSLSIVLFSLILSTGIGSLVSDYIGVEKRARFMLWSVATGGYILAQLVWTPSLLLALDGTSLVVRAIVTVIIILPAGFLMGFGFPTGMRFISAVDGRPTPWFWGINGASGVMASSAAVATSITYGISTTLTLGAVCYLLLMPAALIVGFPRGRREA